MLFYERYNPTIAELARGGIPLPDWNWDYSLADAKIVDVENHDTTLMIKLDCSWTALHTSRYVDQLIFENCDILELPNIAGTFWYNAEVSAQGDRFLLHLVVADRKNHKQTVKLRFSSARY